jgi:RNA-directed DNA polymerase
MPTSALVDVLANAILSGEQKTDAVAARLYHVLGRKWRWVQPLVGRYLQTLAGRVRPRRREVGGFLRRDPGFLEACHKYGHRLKIVHWITGPQSMQPVAAAESWAIPRIETVGALAEWLEVTPSELLWLADLKGLGYKRPQARLAHYHYRVLTKASGSIRLIETPKPRLKELQRRVLSAILDRVPSHPAVHGFVKGRSIQSFAAPHVGQRVVLRMDLENFFPNFPGARVQSFFRTIGYPEPVADLLGGIATNSVPSGAWREVINSSGFAQPGFAQPGFALDPQELWHVRAMYARPHLPQGAPITPLTQKVI